MPPRVPEIQFSRTLFSPYIAEIRTVALQDAEKSTSDRKAKPQGLKPDVFSDIYGTTKVVP